MPQLTGIELLDVDDDGYTRVGISTTHEYIVVRTPGKSLPAHKDAWWCPCIQSYVRTCEHKQLLNIAIPYTDPLRVRTRVLRLQAELRERDERLSRTFCN